MHNVFIDKVEFNTFYQASEPLVKINSRANLVCSYCSNVALKRMIVLTAVYKHGSKEY